MPDHRHDSYDVYGVAQEHHSHYDLINLIEGLRSDLNSLYDQVQHLQEQVTPDA